MDHRDHSTQPSLSVVWSLPSVLWSLAMSACPSMLSTMAGSMGDGWGRQGHSPCIHSWLLLVWILAPGRRERRGTARHCSHRALFGSLFSPICSGAGQRVPKHLPLSTQRTQSQQAHTHDPPVLVSLILFLRPVSGTLPPSLPLWTTPAHTPTPSFLIHPTASSASCLFPVSNIDVSTTTAREPQKRSGGSISTTAPLACCRQCCRVRPSFLSSSSDWWPRMQASTSTYIRTARRPYTPGLDRSKLVPNPAHPCRQALCSVQVGGSVAHGSGRKRRKLTE